MSLWSPSGTCPADPATVTNIGGHECRRHKPDWFDWLVRRLTRRFIERSTQAFLFSYQPLRGPRLPYRMEPWSDAIFVYRIPPDQFPKIETLEVSTADARTGTARAETSNEFTPTKVTSGSMDRKRSETLGVESGTRRLSIRGCRTQRQLNGGQPTSTKITVCRKFS
jgi:hypothetical protein